MALAKRKHRDASVWIIASPRSRTLAVRLPPRVQALQLGSVRKLEARVGQWLGWLRARGVVRIGELMPRDAGQSIAPRWLADPQVCACLGIVLTPATAALPEPAPPAEVWLQAAHRNSLAGVLRDAGKAAAMASWLARLPPRSWEPLQVPLFEMHEPAGGPLQVGWWSRRHRDNGFALGEATVFEVDAGGGIAASLRPIDRDHGPWTMRDGEAGPLPDPAFRHAADHRLDRLFGGVPALAEKLLGAAVEEARDDGMDVAALDAERIRFNRHLEALLSPKLSAVTARLLQRAWPVGGAAPTLWRSRYLHADGDGVRRRRRVELATLAPAIARQVADGLCPAAATAVDAARPLVPALAADFSVPDWAARRTLTLLGQVRSLDGAGVGSPDVLAGYLTTCGVHAPAVSPADLPVIAALARLVPDHADGFGGQAALRAGGREAAISGWKGVRGLLAQHSGSDVPFLLLAWWDHLRHNIADVLAAQGGDDAASEPAIDAVFAAWLQDVSLSESLRFAGTWQAVFWGRDPSMLDEIGTEDEGDPGVRSVFGPMTLPGSRVEVAPLLTGAALRDESRDMRNCVASYWLPIASGSLLVLSLRCTATGRRATAAFSPQPEGRWRLQEVAGVGNAAIAAGIPLRIACDEVLDLLHDPGQLEQAALAIHRGKAVPRRRAVDFTVDGRCLVRGMPPALARVVERCLPGQGPMERRILRAARAAAAERNRTNRG